MARWRFTHRRPLSTQAGAEAVIRYYQRYRRCHGDSLAEFVAHYGKLWARAHRHGVTAYDGIARLIDLFPEEWQDWVTATAKLYIRRQYPAYDLGGDMDGFLCAVSAGCFRYRYRPPAASEVLMSSESKKGFTAAEKGFTAPDLASPHTTHTSSTTPITTGDHQRPNNHRHQHLKKRIVERGSEKHEEGRGKAEMEMVI